VTVGDALAIPVIPVDTGITARDSRATLPGLLQEICMKRILAAATALAALGAIPLLAQPAAPAATPAPWSADQIIATRQVVMDLHQGVLAGMKAVVDNNLDVKPLVAGARGLTASAAWLPALFPPGTDQGHDTKVKPEVWSDRAAFERAAANLRAQAEKLIPLAEANDKAGFATQFRAVSETCLACHRPFRAR
jgi:cytochrome c556